MSPRLQQGRWPHKISSGQSLKIFLYLQKWNREGVGNTEMPITCTIAKGGTQLKMFPGDGNGELSLFLKL